MPIEDKSPNPIDTHVGKRLKQRRMLAKLSQEKLAEALGITFQQIQKYENGTNRISASRLFETAKILGVPVSFFYEGYKNGHKPLLAVAETAPNLDQDIMQQKETLELIRAYYAITDEKVRKSMLETIKNIGQSKTDTDNK